MKKQAKPYVQMKLTGGRMIPHYRLTWREDGKRREKFIRLPEDMDSPEFDAAYWSIRSGKRPVIQKPTKHTWGELITTYRKHPKFTTKAPRTRQSYNSVIDMILEKNGGKAVATLTRAAIRKYHTDHAERSRSADLFVQVVSVLLNFAARTLDWPVANVAEGIELHGKQREYEPWPDWLVRAWPAACARHPNALLAFYLGIYTGQRPGDVAAMKWEHFTGEYMSLVQEKTKTRLDLYCPPALREILAKTPKRGAFIFARNLVEGIGYSAIAKEARKVRDTLGPEAEPFTLHGLRKLAAVQLAEAGCSDAEIQSVTGHKSLNMVQHYRKRAQTKRMSKAAQLRREASGSEEA